MKKGRAPRRPPVWLQVAPLVLGAHALLFWAVADGKFLPRPFASRAAVAPPPAAVAPTFSAREESLSDPETGKELGVRREWTVSTRLANPPPPTPERANRGR